MTVATREAEKIREKETGEKCPYRMISPTGGVLCFDPWLVEYIKPSKEVIDKWCRSDFRSCPSYLNYEEKPRTGLQNHFML